MLHGRQACGTPAIKLQPCIGILHLVSQMKLKCHTTFSTAATLSCSCPYACLVTGSMTACMQTCIPQPSRVSLLTVHAAAKHTRSMCLMHAGVRCQDAHGRAELRREAAVQAGLLGDNYKFLLCRNFVCTICKFGNACTFAHGIQDVRSAHNVVVLPAVSALGRSPCLGQQL